MTYSVMTREEQSSNKVSQRYTEHMKKNRFMHAKKTEDVTAWNQWFSIMVGISELTQQYQLL